MGAIIHTAPAMQTDEDISIVILVDGIDGAGLDAFATADAEFFPDDHPAALALTVCSGGTG